ncbi:hypothetical protein K450DRAFT_228187 [Umbelopsis ramanniana AG]|uniref:DUF6924 domain-containing protein n=1 Tax=Umbelopsis ramanniana AG TaxID=1314678 RepID=A0AAD5EFW1_UMBRA|nr:uncharacterized protein K450DRAFT_228187 [Umbelopsis ramanniana AG]KAI8582275.1 hypothetical protein K450DRAFT_228187 [Umbelopsis ramanniana AG]
MPLYHRNVSEPTLTATAASPPPHLDSSFSYSQGISHPHSINSGSSINESPALSFNRAEHLSKKELEDTINAHKQLIEAATLYREKSTELAAAAAGLGTALEMVAKEKAASDSGNGLQAAAGLQFLISNHHLLLANLISNAFEAPLVDNLERHKASILRSQENYDSVVKAMNAKIGETEVRSLKNTKRKNRDLRQFRRVLQDLTQQIDELETVKIDYSRYVFETEKRNHQFILNKVSGLVRAQVDIYDRISSKGLGEPTLEQMVTSNPDPFCVYPTSDESKAIFSVLPPLSIMDATSHSLIQSPLDFHNNALMAVDSPPTPPPKREDLYSPISNEHNDATQQTEHIDGFNERSSLEDISAPLGDNDSNTSAGAPAGGELEDDEDLIFIRTDYSDEEKWNLVKEKLDHEDQSLFSHLKLQNTPIFSGSTISELCTSQHAKYLLIADDRTMLDQTLALVRCDDERITRLQIDELSTVRSNLYRLDFEEFEQVAAVCG